MADWAHDWTDDEIERLERKFRRQYNQAAREMRERLEDMMKTFDKENSEWQDRVKSGKASKKDYDKWLQDQLTDQDFVRGMSSELAKQANQANQLAMQTINDTIPSVFAENANYAAFDIERSIGKNTHSFDLYDQGTVRRLIAEQPELLPPLQKPRMDNGRDLRWNRQKFASAITQSILQGESIPRAAERIGRVMRTNEGAAIRAARTAITGAENAGRVDSYKRAERIGIELEQEWMATFDTRTRLSHRELHGQHVPVGKYFIASRTTGNKLLYPGDPTADPSEVYNCRCTLVAWFPDIEQEEKPLWTDWKDGTTYDEWKAGKVHEADKHEGTISSPPLLRNIDSYTDDYLKGVADRIRITSEQQQELSGLLGKMFDSSEVYSFVTPAAIEDILKGGHLKNAIELGDYDESYHKDRRDVAKKLFGVDTSSIDAFDFEKYGLVGSSDPQKVLSSGTTATIYGDVCVRFSKSAIMDRTTYTFGDSFNMAQRETFVAGTIGDSPSIAGIPLSDMSRVYRSMTQLDLSGNHDATDITARTVGRRGYIEAQIHGEIDIRHIDEVFVKAKRSGGEWVPEDSCKEIYDALRKSGIKVRLYTANGDVK